MKNGQTRGKCREKGKEEEIQKIGSSGWHFGAESQLDPFPKLTGKKGKNKTKQNSLYNLSYSWSQA